MGNVGIKVSQPNYDVASAEDYKLLFSSSWPNMSIVASGTYTTTDTTTTIVEHNLGYRPMYLIWEKSGTEVDFRNFTGVQFEVNETELREKGGTGLPNRNIFYQIYAIDLDTEFQSAEINTGTADDLDEAIDPNFGIKISKPGKSVYSSDFRDFSVHSRTRSPMVGEVLQFDNTLNESVSHGYGYAPMAYLYGNLGGVGVSTGYLSLYEIAPESGNGWSLTTNSSTVEISKTGSNDNVRLVILKDPMILV